METEKLWLLMCVVIIAAGVIVYALITIYNVINDDDP
jgi:hypothetical protein